MHDYAQGAVLHTTFQNRRKAFFVGSRRASTSDDLHPRAFRVRRVAVEHVPVSADDEVHARLLQERTPPRGARPRPRGAFPVDRPVPRRKLRIPPFRVEERYVADGDLELRRRDRWRLHRFGKPRRLQIAIALHLEDSRERRIVVRLILSRVEPDERDIADTLHKVPPKFRKPSVATRRSATEGLRNIQTRSKCRANRPRKSWLPFRNMNGVSAA